MGTDWYWPSPAEAAAAPTLLLVGKRVKGTEFSDSLQPHGLYSP